MTKKKMDEEEMVNETVKRGSFDDLVAKRRAVYEETPAEEADDRKALKRGEAYGKKFTALEQAVHDGDISFEEFAKREAALGRNYAKAERDRHGKGE